MGRILSAFLMLGISSMCGAQIYKYLGIEDGLSNRRIYRIQKDGRGYIETVIEATNGTNERLIYEGADLIYHMIVLLTSKGYRIEDLARELQERHSSTWKKH